MATAKKTASVGVTEYSAVLSGVVALLEESRRAAARSVNAVITSTYWLIGQRIVVGEQGGRGRAGYGEALVKRLGTDLTARFGRGFGWRNLFQMRAFYLAYREILQAAPAKSGAREAPTRLQALPAISVGAMPSRLRTGSHEETAHG